jgi:ectoine hydroxylase-related dioxygenase (phytanoyl-CoA dioxygenase family)
MSQPFGCLRPSNFLASFWVSRWALMPFVIDPKCSVRGVTATIATILPRALRSRGPYLHTALVTAIRRPSGYPRVDQIDLGAFAELCELPTDAALVPFATSIEGGIPLYDGAATTALLTNADAAQAVAIEWAGVWDSGPGVLIIRGAFPNRNVVDEMSARFTEITAREKGLPTTDHFAPPGANTRIWNALQKCAFLDPKGFLRYYSNPLIALAAEAWLGPWYQVTAQVNVVHPGGAAQLAHRDYHLGFQSAADCARFPRHVHAMSDALVLQGAVAHTQMPVESGPTRFLPGSQRYLDGFIAWRDPTFVHYFEQHAVQPALAIGDAVFFNPSLHHGAGRNTTGADRVANLLEISSAFAKPMEAVDRQAMSSVVFPVLAAMALAGEFSDREVDDIIATVADGYGYPTCLDSPSPDGSRPQTCQQQMRQAVREQWSAERFQAALARH